MPGLRTPPPSGETEAPPRLDGVRVLVIDDEIDSVEVAAASLAVFGAEVSTALSALEALDRLGTVWPDVVLCDIAMPVVNGLAFVGQLRALEHEVGRPLRAAALSGFADESHATRALQAGFDVHLAKPFDPLTLATVVGMLAGRA